MSDTVSMKDKLLLLYLGCILLGISTLTVMANGGKILYIDGNKSIDEGLEHVEDTLILDSLEMNSAGIQRMYDDELSHGEIYYDDDFIDAENDEILRKTETQPEKSTGEGLLAELQKKDSRWHSTTHLIKKGESIWTIARRYDTDYRLIIKHNNIRNADHVKPGLKIEVPNTQGIYYKVENGDTVSEIALKNDLSIEKLQKQNNISDIGTITIGKKLFLPDVQEKKEKIIKSSQDESETAVAQNKQKKRKTKLSKSGLKFQWPVSGRITSAFGMRNHPITGKRQFHNGIDIRAAMDTGIRASEAGTVMYSGWKDGYGWMIVVKHPKNYITVYAHLSKRLKKRKDTVKKGEIIGRSGSSGVSTGPHLHFEIRKYETPLDPMRML